MGIVEELIEIWPNEVCDSIDINENSIEFSLSTQTWSGFKLPQLKSYISVPIHSFQAPESRFSISDLYKVQQRTKMVRHYSSKPKHFVDFR